MRKRLPEFPKSTWEEGGCDGGENKGRTVDTDRPFEGNAKSRPIHLAHIVDKA
jgi:hypothetical protein